MKALQSLRDEHGLIAGVLDALEGYGSRLEQDPSTSISDLRRFAAVLTEFAGIWHHGKEEELLMPVLVQQGLAWDESPLREIREDHEQEDYLLRVIEHAALQEGVQSAEDRRHAVRSIRALVDFERKHIQKEETSLYPVAERLLSADALRSLEERCNQYERACFGRISYADMRTLAEALIEASNEEHVVQTHADPTSAAHRKGSVE
jgi:hemerythrin-like domain-containing protein